MDFVMNFSNKKTIINVDNFRLCADVLQKKKKTNKMSFSTADIY